MGSMEDSLAKFSWLKLVGTALPPAPVAPPPGGLRASFPRQFPILDLHYTTSTALSGYTFQVTSLVGFVKQYNHFLAVDQDSIESRKLS